MAKTTVGGELVLDFKSVGEMRKAIKEATGDVIKMQTKFGETSKEALDAAKRVAMLKDRVKEASEVADLFDPGNKFKVFGNAVQAAAGGFSALQGAMGLFGVESKEMEKQLLKVQSAMALSQGLSTLLDSGKDFSRLAAIIKTQVVTAFTTLRGAMMAVGIGLLTAGIAFLIENFDKVKKVVYDMFPALKGLFDNMDKIKQIAMGVGNAIMQFLSAPISALIKVFKGDFSGAMDALKKGVEFTKNYREGESKEIKSQAEEKEKAREEERKKQAEHNAKLLAEQKKAADERRKAREEERKRQLQEQEEFEQQQRDDWEAAAQEEMRLDAERIALEEQRQQEELDRIKRHDQNKLALLMQQIDEEERQRDQQVTNEKARVDLRLQLADQIGNALGALSELVGRQTKAGKVLALAEIATGTATGFIRGLEIAQKSAAGTGPAAAFAMPLFYASQIAAVLSAAARAKSVLNSGTGGGGGVQSPSINTKAPMQPTLAPTVIANVQNAQAINQMANQSTRAYVLNSDIQNNEQRNAYLQRAATIG